MSAGENPYQSPEEMVGGVAGEPIARAGDVIPYESSRFRAGWIVGLLMVAIAVDVLAAGSDYMEIAFLNRAMSGAAISEEAAVMNDRRQALVGIVTLCIIVACAVAFLMWFHRVHRNLPALGAVNIKYSPRWAVGGFFVPILNLYRPYQVMKEVWAGSDKQVVGDGAIDVGKPSGSALVGWWWAFWILSGIIGQLSGRMYFRAESAMEYVAADYSSIVSSGFSIIAALLAIQVVRSVTANQDLRYERLSPGGAV